MYEYRFKVAERERERKIKVTYGDGCNDTFTIVVPTDGSIKGGLTVTGGSRCTASISIHWFILHIILMRLSIFDTKTGRSCPYNMDTQKRGNTE